jgi:hypothetical protein
MMLKGKRGSRAVVELIILYTVSGINNKKKEEKKKILLPYSILDNIIASHSMQSLCRVKKNQ